MSFAKQPTTFLAMDTSSPVVSVALAIEGSVVEERTIDQRESSKALLPMVEEILSAASVTLKAVDGLLALQGPGSFTGLRVGLSTALGLHQALGLPAMALPTLQVLAAAALAARPPALGRILAAVDARRGAWYTQLFEPSAESASPPLPKPLREPAWTAAADLSGLLPSEARPTPWTIVAMGVEGLREETFWPPESRFLDPGPLAGTAARLAGRLPLPWDASTLTRPLYLSAPSVSRPKA